MSATLYGLTSPVDGKRSGGIDQDRRENVTLTETIKKADLTTRLATLRGTIGSAGLFGTELRRIEWTEMDGELVEISRVFEGAELGEGIGPDPGDPDEADANAVLSLETTTQEQPLLSHPRYSSIIAADVIVLAKVLAGDIDAGEDHTFSALGLEAYNKIKRGVESYLAPTMVLRQRGMTAQGSSDLSKVGRITSVLPGGIPATFGRGQNWLFSGITQTKLGSARYEYERVWLASGFGGWDADLYGPD